MSNPTVRVETSETEAAAWHARLGARSVSTQTIEEFFAWRTVPANADAYRRVEQVWGAAGRLDKDPAIAKALDEALSRVVVDFSGRPGLVLDAKFTSAMIGQLDTQLIHEFFQGFVNHALVTLHIDNLKGANAHHQAETMFKAFGRALRMALERDPRMAGTIPSTKGTL